MTHSPIDVEERVPQPAAVVRAHVTLAELPEFLGGVYAEVVAQLGAQHSAPSGPPFARYTPTGDDGFDVEAGFPATGEVSPAGRVVPTSLPGGTVVTSVHRGDYATLGETYADISAWLPDHGYAVADAPWESYLDEPGVAEPRTLVAFPVHAV